MSLNERFWRTMKTLQQLIEKAKKDTEDTIAYAHREEQHVMAKYEQNWQIYPILEAMVPPRIVVMEWSISDHHRRQVSASGPASLCRLSAHGRKTWKMPKTHTSRCSFLSGISRSNIDYVTKLPRTASANRSHETSMPKLMLTLTTGYRYCAIRPWRWPQSVELADRMTNLVTKGMCYHE